MNLTELWRLYEADKRIQGFSPLTIKAYTLQLKMLVAEQGDLEISEITAFTAKVKSKRLQLTKSCINR